MKKPLLLVSLVAIFILTTAQNWQTYGVITRQDANTSKLINGSNAQELDIYGSSSACLSVKHNSIQGVIDTCASSGNLLIGTSNASSISMGVSAGVNFFGPLSVQQGGSNLSGRIGFSQFTKPSCGTNCGTSPTVQGGDTAGIVTMGATGTPASGWVLTFTTAWSNPGPTCVVLANTLGANNATVTKVVTTTTNMTVTTAAAPNNSDKYNYICIGMGG